MSGRDCELSRLRVDQQLHDAVREAARRQGITMSAWRTIAYSTMLARQLGDWRQGEWNRESAFQDSDQENES